MPTAAITIIPKPVIHYRAMRFDKLRKQLELILLLADTRGYTISELCDRMEVSRRSVYYLLDFLKSAGFVLFRQGDGYHIDRRSPFFARLLKTMQFSDSEMRTIYSLLLMAGSSSETASQLRRKIDRAYNFSVEMNGPQRQQMDSLAKTLTQAIQAKRMVRIVGYSSPHSRSVKDRIVEPFLLMNNNSDIRCHEILSGMNKTFRLNRMEHVEVLDTPWIHEDRHRQMFTDIFMFSGEERYPVRLRLGQLSRNIFLEEYPHGARNIVQEDETHWLLTLDVCDFRGIGRFVIGLLPDMEILGSDAFRDYVRAEVAVRFRRVSGEEPQ
ncbi:helix-turn-helix transcriptional regulator [Prevotella dentasini]